MYVQEGGGGSISYNVDRIMTEKNAVLLFHAKYLRKKSSCISCIGFISMDIHKKPNPLNTDKISQHKS